MTEKQKKNIISVNLLKFYQDLNCFHLIIFCRLNSANFFFKDNNVQKNRTKGLSTKIHTVKI